MKILVALKHVGAVSGVLEVDVDHIDPAFLEFSMSDADGYAVEAALLMRDRAEAAEVVAVTCGGEPATAVVRDAISMGVDRGFRMSTEDMGFDPIAVGRVLCEAVTTESPDLVLMGVQSSDLGQQSVGPATAALLGWPCVVGATVVQVDGRTLTAHRDLEGGAQEIVSCELPAVVTVQTGSQQPRYGSFKDKMAAKKAEIPSHSTEIASRVKVVAMRPALSTGNAEFISGDPRSIAEKLLAMVRAEQ